MNDAAYVKSIKLHRFGEDFAVEGYLKILIVNDSGHMFTGIIEEVGKVAQIEQRGENRRITIHAENTSKRNKNRRQRFCQRRLPDSS